MKISKMMRKKTAVLAFAAVFMAGIPAQAPNAHCLKAAQIQTQTLAQAQASSRQQTGSQSLAGSSMQTQENRQTYTLTGTQTGTVQNPAFSLSKKRLRLRTGQTKVLQAVNIGALSKVKWTVSDKAVVRVQKNASSIRITGLEDGVTAITAKAGNTVCVCRVKVGSGGYMTKRTKRALGLDESSDSSAYGTQQGSSAASSANVTALTLNKYSLMIEQGSSELLTAQYNPADAGAAIVWESSNPALASVSGGLVTAVAPGSVKISAKAGSRQAVCDVLVIEHPKQASITESGYTCYQAGDASHCGITYAAKVYNPNTTFNLALTGIDITVHNKKGAVLKRENCLLTELAPLDTLCAAGDIRLDHARDDIGEVTVTVHSIPVSSFYTQDDKLYLKSSFFTVRNTSQTSDGSGGSRLTGYVQRTVTQSGQYVPYITVLFRRNGVLAGGTRKLLNASGQGAFEIDLDAAQAAALTSCTAEYSIGF